MMMMLWRGGRNFDFLSGDQSELGQIKRGMANLRVQETTLKKDEFTKGQLRREKSSVSILMERKT